MSLSGVKLRKTLLISEFNVKFVRSEKIKCKSSRQLLSKKFDVEHDESFRRRILFSDLVESKSDLYEFMYEN